MGKSSINRIQNLFKTNQSGHIICSIHICGAHGNEVITIQYFEEILTISSHCCWNSKNFEKNSCFTGSEKYVIPCVHHKCKCD